MPGQGKKSPKNRNPVPGHVDIYALRTHNYRRSGTYLMRIQRSPKFNDWFGLVGGDPRIVPGEEGSAYIQPTWVGEIILWHISKWATYCREMLVYQYVLMPDHVHILFRACKYLPIELCNYTAGLVININREIERRSNNPKVLQGQFDMDAYNTFLTHNPHRVAMRLMHPEFFNKVTRVTIGNKTYEAFGNLFLFRNPDKVLVEFHENDGDWKRKQLTIVYDYKVKSRTVMVSPFLNHEEQKILDLAAKNAGLIIKIVPHAMGTDYEPTQWERLLCTWGRLLIISLGLPKEAPITEDIKNDLRDLADSVATSTR